MDGRDLSSALEAEVTASSLRPFLAVRIEFPDPVYAFTGRGTLRFATTDGIQREWLGIHGVASIDTIGESTDGAATGVKATLFQVPEEFRDDIADQAVRGALYELYLGVLDEDYQTVLSVKRLWKGSLQSYDIEDQGETLTISAGGESRAIDQKRPAVKRFTDDWQKRKYPGDRAFEYVAALTEVPVLWAKKIQEPV